MKRISFLAIAILVSVFSCKKISNDTGPSTSSFYAVSTAGIDVVQGVPHYESVELFQNVFEQLEEEYVSHAEQVADQYGDDSTDDEECAVAWQVWEALREPLNEFENTVGFVSYRKEADQLEQLWLSGQTGDDLSTATYPAIANFGIIQSTMMNKDHNFAIGDKIYHLGVFGDEMVNVEINGMENIGLLEEISSNSANKRSLLDWLNTFDDSVIRVTTYGVAEPDTSDPQNPPPPLPPQTCRCNRQDQSWVQVDSKTKYLARHAFYYDFVKTSAVFEICAYAKIKIIGWVPAATNLKAGIQIYHKYKDCTDLKGEWTGESAMWGNHIVRQINYWNAQRSVENATMNIDNSYPETGLWGAGKVKNLCCTIWTKLPIY